MRGSVVKSLTRNPGVLGSSRTGSFGFFRWSVLGQDGAQPSTGETQESMNNVSCCSDMTEKNGVKHHSINQSIATRSVQKPCANCPPRPRQNPHPQNDFSYSILELCHHLDEW